AYAVYQYAVELPRTRAVLQPTAEDREVVRQELARLGVTLASDDADLEMWARKLRLSQKLVEQNVHVDLDDPQLDNWVKRTEMNNVYATFAHPNSFAGYLALLLPVLVGWATAAPWRGPSACRGWLTTACAALVGAALWLTHSRGALLGTLLALGLLGMVLSRPLPARKRLLLGLAGALGAAGLAAGGALLGKEARTAS